MLTLLTVTFVLSSTSLGNSLSLTFIFLFFSFFVTLIVYVVGGAAFNYHRDQKVGKEMLPNYNFWSLVPGLILVSFSFKKKFHFLVYMDFFKIDI